LHPVKGHEERAKQNAQLVALRGAQVMIDWKRFKELLAERRVVVALVLVAIVVIWMFRFETFGYQGLMHRNRITGAICAIDRECWWPRGRFN
jgi:hypothetical protein